MANSPTGFKHESDIFHLTAALLAALRRQLAEAGILTL